MRRCGRWKRARPEAGEERAPLRVRRTQRPVTLRQRDVDAENPRHPALLESLAYTQDARFELIVVDNASPTERAPT
jgi:hypothetical protein